MGDGAGDFGAVVVESEDIGYFGGPVVIPETTTFMFYGPDAEAISRALEPRLIEEPLCRGAKITVRQGDRHREVYLPTQIV